MLDPTWKASESDRNWSALSEHVSELPSLRATVIEPLPRAVMVPRASCVAPSFGSGSSTTGFVVVVGVVLASPLVPDAPSPFERLARRTIDTSVSAVPPGRHLILTCSPIWSFATETTALAGTEHVTLVAVEVTVTEPDGFADSEPTRVRAWGSPPASANAGAQSAIVNARRSRIGRVVGRGDDPLDPSFGARRARRLRSPWRPATGDRRARRCRPSLRGPAADRFALAAGLARDDGGRAVPVFDLSR